MPRDAMQEPDWLRLSGLIAKAMGLHFPPERWSELRHRMVGMAAEFGFTDVAECVDWLVSAPLGRSQIQSLARHLTVGETYFFREHKTLAAFAQVLLPDLIHARRGRDQQLRLWCAACCTGEEAYSLAILVRHGLPDLAEWNVKILATDINPAFLERASAGIYSDWACRNVPAALKESSFNRSADGRWVEVPEVRKMVTFAPLNLAGDAYPGVTTDTNAMDFIFCRNALIYFTPANIRKVATNFHRALNEGGWLAVSPSEATAASFPQFAVVNLADVILFQKSPKLLAHRMPARGPPAGFETPRPLVKAPLPVIATPPQPNAAPKASRPTSQAMASSFYDQGLYAEAVEILLTLATGHAQELPVVSLLARSLANQ